MRKRGGAFIFVYIAEAHAMDEWPLMSKLAMPEGRTAIVERQHTTTAERCAAALAMRDTYDHKLAPMYLVVDPMDGGGGGGGEDDGGEGEGEVFSRLLNPWPTRFYIMEPNDNSDHRRKPTPKRLPTANDPSAKADDAAVVAAAGAAGPQAPPSVTPGAAAARAGAGATAGVTAAAFTGPVVTKPRPGLTLSWVSFFEPDSSIDFSKFSTAALSRLA